ncbi:MAG: hypothetical protein HY231_15000 [Acidobacteria bacterium]|nr:hypothetical protein [Acidobacteriota bacterium]
MEIIKTKCPACEWPLEFPEDFDNVTCNTCGTAFRVRHYKGNVNLAVIGEDRKNAAELAEAETRATMAARLAEVTEDIEKVREEIEVLKSNEQIAPLQIGCAFFGMFGFLLLLLALFATVAKNYFGGWLFYLSIITVILLSLLRMRRKLPDPQKLDYYRRERATLEAACAQLEAEKAQVEKLQPEVFASSVDAKVSEPE